MWPHNVGEIKVALYLVDAACEGQGHAGSTPATSIFFPLAERKCHAVAEGEGGQYAVSVICDRAAGVKPAWTDRCATLAGVRPRVHRVRIIMRFKLELCHAKRSLVRMTATFVSDRDALRTLVERVRDQRLARNWTQSEMALRCGLSRRAYQDFEFGEGNLTLRNLSRLLGVLGFTERLRELVPPPAPKLTLDDVVRPRRLRAARSKRRLGNENP